MHTCTVCVQLDSLQLVLVIKYIREQKSIVRHISLLPLSYYILFYAYCIGYSWISATSHSAYQPNAVLAGHDIDGAQIYVGRSYHEGDLLPAKVIPSKNVAYVSHGGSEIQKNQFEVQILLSVFRTLDFYFQWILQYSDSLWHWIRMDSQRGWPCPGRSSKCRQPKWWWTVIRRTHALRRKSCSRQNSTIP